jgi:hypothetical protein
MEELKRKTEKGKSGTMGDYKLEEGRTKQRAEN